MLIVLSGKARSGKDTASKIIKDYLDSTIGPATSYTLASSGATYPVYADTKCIAYADCLKEVCAMVFGLTDRYLYGFLKDEPIAWMPKWTTRSLMQYLGTDIFRKIYPDCWVDHVKRKVFKDYHNMDVIITDARFSNEIDWVLESGGVHIHIERENRDFCADTSHTSENALPEFESNGSTYVVHNDSSVEELRENLIDIIETWRIKNG